ncbi:DUF4142 domain-containing protein [Chitiniphilus purpureus]|uniref:DUF4142 domain-containing protein n=1 Tax=Chitiniphilus purpureus TaxID=2981137 RepID=A0ABY6DJN8_9NEIS|nr:DUF4142 domain-containing protein [Chitiniphilus sp. CD1]UXY14448.1 DUF4142 domain-containing protein [Chitiniphilus sp. CD1]
MKHRLQITCLVAALAAYPAFAISADPVTKAPPAKVEPSGVHKMDTDFVAKAGASGLAEVEAGRMALKKTSTDGVRQLANMLIDDHTKANERLNTLAGLKNLSVPSEPGEANRKKLAELEGKSGTAFDEAFLKQQREAHEEAIDLFSKQAKSGKDADLKKFAAETLPKLQAHLKHVRSLQKGGHDK